MVVGGIAGGACDFQDAVAAGQRLADVRAVPDMGGSLRERDLRHGRRLRKRWRRGKPAARACAPACRPPRARAPARRSAARARSCRRCRPEGLASASAASAARRKDRRCRSARRRGIRSASRARHGFRGNAAEREPRLHDRVLLDAQSGRGRDDRERVGRAVADFEVAGMSGEARRLGRQRTRDDQLAGLEHASRARARRRASDETFRAEFRAGLPGPRPRRRRRARPTARKNRTGASRCSSRSIP